ncbi:MAG: NADH-quinone oxidoreductase subunit N [Ignavibacteria bacterium]|nr:NADH-quinone oxidoreductase subunit N [Ignavibacteria bacterium]
MNSLNFFNNLGYAWPETIITLFLAILVIYNLVYPQARRALGIISLLGIALALGFTIQQMWTQFPTDPSWLSGFTRMLIPDKIGIFFKVIILIATAYVVLFTEFSEELRGTFDRAGEYYALIFGMLLGMMFMISANNFILLYVSLELVSYSSYVLAGFMKTSERSSEASMKYIIYGGVASGIMLFGISLMFGMTGTFYYFDISRLLMMININSVLFLISGIMIFTGIGYKISSVPFHFWTPDVYEGAPTTITAYLSVASKAAGFAALIHLVRNCFVGAVATDGYWVMLSHFYWKELLVYLAILTMTVGNLTALWQDNLKRMLAYSSIAHAGYLLAAMSVLSNQGLIAMVVYFSVYLLMNLGAFFIVILIQNKTGSENIDDYNGLGTRMPFLGACLGIFLVSLTGLPPTAGFIGKLYLFLALVDAKMIILAIIALLNSVISLYYYIRVLRHMYLTKGNNESPITPSFGSVLIALSLAVPVLLFGIYFTPLIEWAKTVVLR